ncbi:MAG: tripartite tricarboxylate transporter substrate binding protein, partial [Betaproteobacteria bacterium]|nr:tripartite tricarboxylate transporter substrate binding protein [Betaproteobacteria bacterium]
GAGGINHLAAEMLKSMTGIRIVHIPYKGLGPALTALLAGEVQLMIATLGSSLPHIRSGKLRALALAGAKRSSSAPDLATLAESGVAGYEVDNWYGVLVPRGTPRGIIGVLNKRIVAIVGSEDVRERFAALGFETAASTPVRFADYLKSEIAKWARAMKDAGVTPG